MPAGWLTAFFTRRAERTDPPALAQIDEHGDVISKGRKEIADNALKLHEGRRANVGGDRYRDQNHNVLTGSERDKAAAFHRFALRRRLHKRYAGPAGGEGNHRSLQSPQVSFSIDGLVLAC